MFQHVRDPGGLGGRQLPVLKVNSRSVAILAALVALGSCTLTPNRPIDVGMRFTLGDEAIAINLCPGEVPTKIEIDVAPDGKLGETVWVGIDYTGSANPGLNLIHLKDWHTQTGHYTLASPFRLTAYTNFRHGATMWNPDATSRLDIPDGAILVFASNEYQVLSTQDFSAQYPSRNCPSSSHSASAG